jgi:hypothetical protein
VSWDPLYVWFKVQFIDGDEEELTYAELLSVLVDE